jgi:hypothetical protein
MRGLFVLLFGLSHFATLLSAGVAGCHRKPDNVAWIPVPVRARRALHVLLGFGRAECSSNGITYH